MSTETAVAQEMGERLRQRRAARAWLLRQLADEGFIVVLLLWVVYLAIATANFATLSNLLLVVSQAAIYAIVAIGTTLVVLLGELDISFGSVISLAGCVAANAVVGGAGVAGGIAVGVGIGLLFGAVNGVMVTYLRIPSVVTTLATMGAGAGLAALYSGGTTIFGNGLDAIGFLTQGTTAGIPDVAVLALVLYLISWVILTKTRAGAHLYATGDNEQAAFRCAINVRRIRMVVFIVAGGLAGLGALLQAAQLGQATSDMGTGALFPVLTAVILGGISISGGRGKIVNTLVACIFLASITNGLILLGVDPTVQQIVQGAVLALAVSLDRLRR
ncbi:MAG TPA: ABC transporter permease [Streptosporangiaceae bacterium]|nr:ABC transporter permease [Streptosporangiaceae bacterium]